MEFVSLPDYGRMMERNFTGESAFTVLRVNITDNIKKKFNPAEYLSKIKRYRAEDTVNYKYPKIFSLEMRHTAWTINGRTFSMEVVANDEKVKMNTIKFGRSEMILAVE